jgi:hypothetical protein
VRGSSGTPDLQDLKPAAEWPIPDNDVVSGLFTTFDELTVDVRLLDKDDAH